MLTFNLSIRSAQPSDRQALVLLLKSVNLPTDDLPLSLDDFVLAFDGNNLVGSAGIEVEGKAGLLRSVAVSPLAQGRHIGYQLVEKALQVAYTNGIKELYLITTTADYFFERYGWSRISRQEVPALITQKPQFSGLCPASAIVMKKLV